MKKILFLAFLSTFSCLTFASDSVINKVKVGVSSLDVAFINFENKHAECLALAESTKLSASVIEQLRELPSEASSGLGYLSQRAIRNCAITELNEVMRLILTLEVIIEKEQYLHPNRRITSIKNLMFSMVDLNTEVNYLVLSDDIKRALDDIDKLNYPFNLVDSFERAWFSE
ncbi:hypothetical protein HC752_23345 [Vibrio sp. S9_S30]|uniref:hypothetical protein n=1 Tax=Vibrio sp. S9_S30 TaxID=2720226 RepID=UPI0016809D54|nr:hypothetical protein [Vibrio sp. S9_S30]MBD1559868.1 hypothetical protein [Vibrio sp. S9_S30]